MKRQQFFVIVYEDDDIVVLNKSAGIAVSPDRWDISRERLDILAAEFLGIEKLYTVHRIDRDTSGLVVFAKNSEIHKTLSAAFEDRKIKKRYIAAVCGRPSWNPPPRPDGAEVPLRYETSCDLPLVPNGNKLHLTIVDKYRGKPSLTRFHLLGSAGNYSILEAFPETGRTHQIRVHLAALGHPVVCDKLYGNAKFVLLSSIKRGWQGDPLKERPLLARLGLHAAELVIPGYDSLKAPLPRDMTALIKQMEKAAGQEFGV